MVTDIEADLVGVAILNPETTNARVDGHQFEAPMLGAMWDAIRVLHRDGVQPDPVTIVEAAKPARVDHAAVVEVMGRFGTVANVDAYAEVIAGRWARDQLDLELSRAKARLADPDTSTDAVVAQLTAALDRGEAELDSPTLTLDEFVSQPLPAEEWIIDGLVSRGDRVVITGSEGAGKSLLMRELAVCAAAGLHPFGEQPMAPRRVLVIDAENPLRIMVKTYGWLHSVIRRHRLSTDDRLWIHRFPQGINLGAVGDRMKLHSLCRKYRPDLLVIGPAYKLYIGGSNSREEDLARLVTSTLDGLREEFGFAVILEHHSPHAAPGVAQRSVRPIGSSLWMRWPEFGIGLRLERDGGPGRRTAEVVHWRGPRDERPWPERLESSPGLPWVEGAPL